MNVEPEWLAWAREIAAIAQSGLAFSPNQYDRERYERLRTLSAIMIASRAAERFERIEALFGCEAGYATPKVDVRGAVFDGEMRILLVRERADADRWSLPGGWADVNLTAAENVIKEVEEESGLRVRAVKLAVVFDRTRQGHTPGIFSCYKLFFLCEVIGGAAAPGCETSAVGWFAEDRIPDDLSLGRVLPGQIRRLFQHARDAALPTDFE
ncbi:MAG: NUDIX hydrolase [Acetobacteraceae bacterium]